jgi:Ca2+-binding EF-hand superfamily protein
MMKRRGSLIIWGASALLTAGVLITSGGFAQRASVPKAQDKIALGENDVKQLLLLMDTDKNGKISKKEYMDFMEKEFNRLDKDKNGELDPKELTQSLLRPAPPPLGK